MSRSGALRMLWPYIVRYRWPVVAATVALLMSAGLVLVLGQGLRHLIDGGFASGSPARLNATAAAMATRGRAARLRHRVPLRPGHLAGRAHRRRPAPRRVRPGDHLVARLVRDGAGRRRAVPPAGGHGGAAGAGRLGAIAVAALRPAAAGRVRHAGRHLAAAVRPGAGRGAVRGGAAGGVLPARARRCPASRRNGWPTWARWRRRRSARCERCRPSPRSRSPASASRSRPSSRWLPPAPASARAPR